jgi:hypothetical protein
MFHKPITVDQKATPKWAVCDREIDITDVWLEETDPENARGEEATAYLKANKYNDGLEVVGVSIKEPEGDCSYWPRRWAENVMGWDAILRIEQYETQSPEYGDDDECDIRKEERV